MATYLKKIILFHLALIFSISCREDVVAPDNFVGRINDPVQISERNSYIMMLNADKFTMELTVPTYFSSVRTRFNVTLIDYETGYTSVSVQDVNTTERFRFFIAEDVSYHTELLDGYIPNTIKIRTENFSGKIKIEFRKTL
jgi:hypothetical protein